MEMRGWNNRDGINGEGQLLPWPASLLLYPKHGPLQRTWVPLAPWTERGLQLGDRGLLGGAQLAARVLTALKHRGMNVDTLTSMSKYACLLKNKRIAASEDVTQCRDEDSNPSGQMLDYELDRSMDVNGHLWKQKPTLPQHCSDDRPCHQPSKSQVQPEKASSHSCSHTETFILIIHDSNVLACVRFVLKQFVIWFNKDYKTLIVTVSTRNLSSCRAERLSRLLWNWTKT